MAMEPSFWHEKLDVYQRSLAFVSSLDDQILNPPVKIAAIDHLDRAAESILENIVSGNSSWSTSIKRRHLGIARGSALECAACLDIFHTWQLIQTERWREQKGELRRIVQMLAGLIRLQKNEVADVAEYWECKEKRETVIFFEHERLDVYQLALEFIQWIKVLKDGSGDVNRRVKRLDTLTTSIVLNIAEGNGRFDFIDHRQFIDIAHQSALKCVVALDLMVAKKELIGVDVNDAKQMLSRIVKMLVALRRSMDKRRNTKSDNERDYERDNE